MIAGWKLREIIWFWWLLFERDQDELWCVKTVCNRIFCIASEDCWFLTYTSMQKTYHFLCGGLWAILSFLAHYGIKIEAVFAQSWRPVELDVKPWDSFKGFCNLRQVSGGEYWDHTSIQRHLTCSGSKSIKIRTQTGDSNKSLVQSLVDTPNSWDNF